MYCLLSVCVCKKRREIESRWEEWKIFLIVWRGEWKAWEINSCPWRKGGSFSQWPCRQSVEFVNHTMTSKRPFLISSGNINVLLFSVVVVALMQAAFSECNLERNLLFPFIRVKTKREKIGTKFHIYTQKIIMKKLLVQTHSWLFLEPCKKLNMKSWIWRKYKFPSVLLKIKFLYLFQFTNS